MQPASRRAGVSAAAILLLAGCTTAPFRENVASFAASTQVATRSVSAAERALADDQSALFRVDVADGRLRAIRMGDCGAQAPGAVLGACRIGPARPAAASSAPVVITDEERYFIGVIGRYAEGLAALTSAADSAALAKASKDFNEAVGTATSAAGPYGAVAGAVIQAVVWATGLALEQERFAALDQAVRARHRNIETLAPVIGEVLERLRAARIASLNRGSDLLLAGLSRPGHWADRTARFDLATERAATLAAVVAIDPRKLSADIVAAHAALLAALDDPQLRGRALLPAIQQLREQATALQAAFATLRTP